MKSPQHVGIIMDGNGRWANLKGKARVIGHIKGARVARSIINWSAENKLPHLTLYAFSTENWVRPLAEISFLMRLLHRSLVRERENLFKYQIRFTAIGSLHRLPEDLATMIHDLMEQTKSHKGMHLTFALSYGSRWEITEAVKKIAEKVKQGDIEPYQITEDVFSRSLCTRDTPDPDLIVRTSGEHRLSNFLLWQAAYSELYFSSTLWPDFTIGEFSEILSRFAQRERRFGGVHQDASQQLFT